MLRSIVPMGLQARTRETATCSGRSRGCVAHRWNGNPRTQPQTFGKLVFLIEFRKSYICLNWLSGALVGVGGSDFIG